ncbi:MAG: ThiF family adenylyltransferase [Synergistaceae bacterium]|jgi:integrative and conjugative element protein (TIGR02256 family)|nr:ThiF family adenylyltransferase [Synergistaceae bacterium]
MKVPFVNGKQDSRYGKEGRSNDFRKNPLETGGMLVGNWERGSDGTLKVHVERASGPGSRATHKAVLFSPALDHYRARASYYRQKRSWDYIGEWHKHPGDFASLSATDVETAQTLLQEEGWPLLLLPIVTCRDGSLSIDNHVMLSRQLGGGGIFYAGRFSSTLRPSAQREIQAYIDDTLIRDFRGSSKEEEEYPGLHNHGESYIFIPLASGNDARLRLVRAGKDIPFTDTAGCVTAIVGESDVRCYHVNEGEILPLPHVLIDPGSSIYERNSGLMETSVLRGKTVTLVGCGSLGSTMSMALARAGVGAMHLFDYDTLSPANIARHQGDLRDLGRCKASVVREHIQRVNPTLNVSVHKYDVVEEPEGLSTLENLALKSDLLICATDTDDSRMLVNSLAVRLRIKSLQAGLHERASSGIVHLYDPEEQQACFACHRRRILSESGKRAEGLSYTEAENIRELTAQPGFSAQIDLVAQVGALRAIEALSGPSALPALSIVYVDKTQASGNGMETDAPRRLQLRIAHLTLERVDACPICGAWDENANLAQDVPDEDCGEGLDGSEEAGGAAL